MMIKKRSEKKRKISEKEGKKDSDDGKDEEEEEDQGKVIVMLIGRSKNSEYMNERQEWDFFLELINSHYQNADDRKWGKGWWVLDIDKTIKVNHSFRESDDDNFEGKVK